MKWRLPTRRGAFLHITIDNLYHVIKTARKESDIKDCGILCSISYATARDIININGIDTDNNIKAVDVIKRHIFGRTFKGDVEFIVVPYESLGEIHRKNDLSNVCGPIRQWASCQGNKNGLPSVSVPRLRAAPYEPASNKSISVDYIDTNKAIEFMNEGSIFVSLLGGDARIDELEALKEKGTRKLQRVNEMSIKLLKEQLNRVTDKSKIYFPFDGGVFEGQDGRDGATRKLVELLMDHKTIDHCEIRGLSIGEPIQRRLRIIADVTKSIMDIPDRSIEITLANSLGTLADLAMAFLVNPKLIVECSLPFQLGEALFALVFSHNSYKVHQECNESGDMMDEAVEAVNEWKTSSDWFSHFPITVLDISDRSLSKETSTFLSIVGSVPEIFTKSSGTFPSLGYLQHLVNSREMLAEQLLTRHNVFVYERIINMFSFGTTLSYEQRCLFLYLFSNHLKRMGAEHKTSVQCTKILSEEDLKVTRKLPPSYAIIEGNADAADLSPVE